MLADQQEINNYMWMFGSNMTLKIRTMKSDLVKIGGNINEYCNSLDPPLLISYPERIQTWDLWCWIICNDPDSIEIMNLLNNCFVSANANSYGNSIWREFNYNASLDDDYLEEWSEKDIKEKIGSIYSLIDI